ncbi:VOC family protein [Streptomyces sp. SID5785]|uniref:VOC family protein n=1 Tax=Streptomyces sp. SID5785 TaxID=2690309 RepID=UPI0013611968|nr:VOC family protein [Streptomyces sp. SID5785]MZD06200.1 VOC family protein [Streptomyces sp. SID5785]
MTSRLFAICFRAARPADLAEFWAAVLGRQAVVGTRGDAEVLPAGADGYLLRFVPGQEPRTGRNRAHFDLTSSSAQDQRDTVDRALAHGARPLDVGQLPEEGHVVLADPDGNEFCVIEPGNAFLAGTGAVGALACDGTSAVGRFWSAALGWPLVWDQDEETAVQAPDGGTKITWGGPPVAPKHGTNRLFLELEPPGPTEADRAAEADRLVALGATLPGAGGPRSDGALLLLDPDGNEFTLRAG